MIGGCKCPLIPAPVHRLNIKQSLRLIVAFSRCGQSEIGNRALTRIAPICTSWWVGEGMCVSTYRGMWTRVGACAPTTGGGGGGDGQTNDVVFVLSAFVVVQRALQSSSLPPPSVCLSRDTKGIRQERMAGQGTEGALRNS